MLRSEMPDYVETRGAKSIFSNLKKLASELEDIKNGSIVLTNYMKHQMEDKGYIEIVPREPNGLRGRPPSDIVLTPKSIRLINISKAWKKADQTRDAA